MTRTPPSLFVLCTVVAMSSAACGGGGGVSTRTDGGADTGTEGGPDTATDGSVDALDSGLSGELVGPPPCVPGEEECRPSRLAVAPGITCAIDSAGELLCWGTNAGGLAGSGTSDSKVPPTVVAVAGPWTTVSAGPRAVCAIHENLRLYCWGTGTIGAGTVPTEIAPGTSWRDITVGDMHLCGIHDDGTLWCRGVVEGWLPEPERAHTTFTQVGTATDWESIEASDRTCGIRSGGALLCWGRAFAGVGQVATPTEIAPGTDWRTVSLGPDSACAIDSSGALFCWGNEVTGDLGDGQNAPAGHATPQPIATGQTWVSVAVSGGFSCAVDTAGATWCWGREGLWPGRAGDVRHAPRRIATGRTATEVALSRFTGAAGVHACVALSDGTHSCFGSNAFGQLGMGTASATVELRPVAAGTWDRAPSIGGHSVCGIDADAALRCWGSPAEYAGSDPRSFQVPTTILDDASWLDVGLGFLGGCAIRSDGQRWCWGGASTFTPASDTTSARVDNHDDWTAVEVSVAGGGWACGLRGAGSLWCWGYNSEGQLGVGDTDSREAPVQVGTETGWTAVAAGRSHACAIRGGALWCWGDDNKGQLGDGAATGGTEVPIQIGTDTDWTQVIAHGDQTCGLRGEDLWCWGSVLRIGNELAPRRVEPAGRWQRAALGIGDGGRALCGIRSGVLLCWGLATPNAASSNTTTIDLDAQPAQIGDATDWIDVAIGEGVVCATHADNTLHCLGLGAWGETGTGDAWIDAPWAE